MQQFENIKRKHGRYASWLFGLMRQKNQNQTWARSIISTTKAS
jgi:hypothetical protein